jgi:hypothetical protein
MESSGRGASSVRMLFFGNPERPREEGSEDGYVCSPGTLRDRGLRGRICLFTGNSERWLKGGSTDGASLSMRAPFLGEPGEVGSFVGDPEGYLEKAPSS